MNNSADGQPDDEPETEDEWPWLLIGGCLLVGVVLLVVGSALEVWSAVSRFGLDLGVRRKLQFVTGAFGFLPALATLAAVLALRAVPAARRSRAWLWLLTGGAVLGVVIAAGALFHGLDPMTTTAAATDAGDRVAAALQGLAVVLVAMLAVWLAWATRRGAVESLYPINDPSVASDASGSLYLEQSGATRAQLKELARRNEEEGRVRWTLCPVCGERIDVDAFRCWSCGSDLSGQPVEEPPSDGG